MLKILFIGSSKIIEEHIKAALKLNFILYSLNSTKKKSNNQKKIYKKYNFEQSFMNWQTAIRKAGNKKDVVFFIASRTSDTENILKICSKYQNKIFVEKPITLKNKKINFENSKNIFVGYNRIYFNIINKLKKKN